MTEKTRIYRVEHRDDSLSFVKATSKAAARIAAKADKTCKVFVYCKTWEECHRLQGHDLAKAQEQRCLDQIKARSLQSLMRTNSKLVRDTDKKVFTVTLLSHWSDITAEDGETDRVKWGFDNTYVSNKGLSYTLQTDSKSK